MWLRRNQIDDLDAAVGALALNARVDVGTYPQLSGQMNEVLFGTGLVNDHGRRDPWRTEAAELDGEASEATAISSLPRCCTASSVPSGARSLELK
ncbi:hypothetical protein BH18ACT12_BH18ACT12_12710 [soil metagenome]